MPQCLHAFPFPSHSPMPSAQQTILVTGGAGFIGSHLVEHLLMRGDRVIVVDDLSTGRRENLAGCEDAITDGRLAFIEGSVLEVLEGNPSMSSSVPQCLHASMPSVDAIYHLAAAVGVRMVVEQPIHTIETNVLETSALMRFAQQHDTPTFIASTSEVYGKGVRTPFAEDDDVVYGATVHNRWSYACSKAIDEFLAIAYRREHGLHVVIGRLFNTVGPRQRGDYGMVLPRFIAAAMADEPIEVHGDGQQSRCFCDVRDVVPAIVGLMEASYEGMKTGRQDDRERAAPHGSLSDPSIPPIFNIGSDRLMTILELADLVKRTLNSRSEIVHVSYDAAYGAGFDDLRTRQPDLTRIRTAIHWSPSVPLEQTISDIATTFMENPDARRRVTGMKS